MANQRKRSRPATSPSRPPGKSTQHHRELVATQVEYRGPLPHPDILDRYEQIHPGTAERIIRQFEGEAQHRHAMEREILSAQIAHEQAEVGEIRRGQIFAFLLGAIGLLVGGAVSLFSRSDAGAYAGAGIGGATLVGLVTAFIVGRKVSPSGQAEQSVPENAP